MSVTVAHKPHVRVPWLSVIVVLAIAAAAVLAAALIAESLETTPVATEAQVSTAAGASVWTADLPKNRSPVVRAFIVGGMPPAAPAEAPTNTLKTTHLPRHTEP